MNETPKTPEPLSAILKEMRADVADGENAFFIRADWLALCDRIEAATARNAKTFWNMLEGAVAAMDGMREERDRAVKYANAAPHPGSASWKEMQAAFEAAKERKPEENYGNTSAMRAALEDVLEKIDVWRTDGTMEHWQYSQLFDICDAAISASGKSHGRV